MSVGAVSPPLATRLSSTVTLLTNLSHTNHKKKTLPQIHANMTDVGLSI